jgi:hypothetical protein
MVTDVLLNPRGIVDEIKGLGEHAHTEKVAE